MEVISPSVELKFETSFCSAAAKATLHPTVVQFLSMSNEEVVAHYCTKINKKAAAGVLLQMLKSSSKWFHWSGIDFMLTENGKGERAMTVIEANSCPSGNSVQAVGNYGFEGYRRVINDSFVPWVMKKCPDKTEGGLAVFIDLIKNHRECRTYASMLARAMNEDVILCNIEHGDVPFLKWQNGTAWIEDKPHHWIPLRAVFRKVVHRPWTKVLATSKTRVYNPMSACLAGGRNKAVAYSAYEEFNRDYAGTGLAIKTPWTRVNVRRDEVESIAAELGYQLVIKAPYSNAGLAVYIINCPEDLKTFYDDTADSNYSQYLVQELICPSSWRHSSCAPANGELLCPIPAVSNGNGFVFSMRFMLVSGPNGWKPVSFCAPRAPLPISLEKPEKGMICKMLKTNASAVQADGTSQFEFNRLTIFSESDFTILGLTLDDLIDAYVQSVMTTLAIDKYCDKLTVEKDGFCHFDKALFEKMNPDPGLLNEIMSCSVSSVERGS